MKIFLLVFLILASPDSYGMKLSGGSKRNLSVSNKKKSSKKDKKKSGNKRRSKEDDVLQYTSCSNSVLTSSSSTLTISRKGDSRQQKNNNKIALLEERVTQLEEEVLQERDFNVVFQKEYEKRIRGLEKQVLKQNLEYAILRVGEFNVLFQQEYEKRMVEILKEDLEKIPCILQRKANIEDIELIEQEIQGIKERFEEFSKQLARKKSKKLLPVNTSLSPRKSKFRIYQSSSTGKVESSDVNKEFSQDEDAFNWFSNSSPPSRQPTDSMEFNKKRVPILRVSDEGIELEKRKSKRN